MRLPNAEHSRSIAPQHLAFIERDPRAKWFVTSPNEAGEQQVYLNFEVTGWYPKFYGPFPNQDAALKCLNELLISLAIRSMMPGWRPTSRNRTSVTVGFRQLLYDRLGKAARLMMRVLVASRVGFGVVGRKQKLDVILGFAVRHRAVTKQATVRSSTIR